MKPAQARATGKSRPAGTLGPGCARAGRLRLPRTSGYLSGIPRLILVGALLVVGLFLSGCSDVQTTPGNEAADEALLIVPGKAVGEVKAEMNVKEVIEKLGEPQRRTQNALEYTRMGFAVMPDRDGTVQVVMCGDVTGSHGPLVKRFTGRTQEGIGMGSTKEELLKAYGPPTNAEIHAGSRESLEYKGIGITFSLESGKVHHMIVRLGEEFHSRTAIEVGT